MGSWIELLQWGGSEYHRRPVESQYIYDIGRESRRMAVFLCTNSKTVVSGDCDSLLRGGRCGFVEGMKCPSAKKARGRELDRVRQALKRELEYCHTVGRIVRLRDKGKVVMILRPVLGDSWREAGDDRPYGRELLAHERLALEFGKEHLAFEVVDLLLKNSWDLEGMERLSTPSSWKRNP